MATPGRRPARPRDAHASPLVTDLRAARAGDAARATISLADDLLGADLGRATQSVTHIAAPIATAIDQPVPSALGSETQPCGSRLPSSSLRAPGRSTSARSTAGSPAARPAFRTRRSGMAEFLDRSSAVMDSGARASVTEPWSSHVSRLTRPENGPGPPLERSVQPAAMGTPPAPDKARRRSSVRRRPLGRRLPRLTVAIRSVR
jgi:hypothetical protein